jgi:hypothetical protein
MIKKKQGYKAPPRTSIVLEVVKLLPDVPVGILEELGFTPLYAIHSEIVCYGLDPYAVAEVNIPGYKCVRDVSAGKEAVKRFRRELKQQLKDHDRRKKEAARAKAQAAKERARAAKERARAGARAKR